MNVADIFFQQRRLWVRLHEKRSKFSYPATTRSRLISASI